MAYCTSTDVTNAFDNVLLAQLTTPSGTVVGTAFINQVAANVSALMDSHFDGRYITPITDPATLLYLKPHAIRLVISELLQDRLMLERFAAFKANSDSTLAWLGMVQSNLWSLGPACQRQAVVIDTSAAATAVYVGSYPRTFGADPLTAPSPNAPTVTIL